MKRREFIAMGASALACSLVPRAVAGRESPGLSECVIPGRFSKHPLFTTPHCGVNFGFLARRGYFSRPEVRRQPALIREAGPNWVTLNTHFCQETFASRKVFLDFDWSSGERELVDMIKALHGEGLHVMLKPCLTSLDSAWMGAVTFPWPSEQQIQGVRQRYAEEWFDSLRECLSYFGDIAEETGCEALIAGAEYNGTTKFDAEWRKTIAHVRKHFGGLVTYEFMPREPSERPLKWFEDLDFLALSTYPSGVDAPDSVLWDLANWKNLPPISKASMEKALAKHVPLVESFVERFGKKPILFSEIGTRSCRGCVNVPGDYKTESIWDGQEQADYMDAAFSTFSKLPAWIGLSWWKWDETQHTRHHYSPDPLKDRGFTICGKPAAAVMRKWAKGWR
ncbi:MAG: hypothetical protein IJG84_22780 [Kiritimatiellae bacterium]|nr:hypothetical protein [Kiritimatiellia bacterium]